MWQLLPIQNSSQNDDEGSRFMPQISIVDSDFTKTVPPKVTAATGVDALCHALESYVSVKANEVTQLFSLEAMKKILNTLSGI